VTFVSPRLTVWRPVSTLRCTLPASTTFDRREGNPAWSAPSDAPVPRPWSLCPSSRLFCLYTDIDAPLRVSQIRSTHNSSAQPDLLHLQESPSLLPEDHDFTLRLACRPSGGSGDSRDPCRGVMSRAEGPSRFRPRPLGRAGAPRTAGPVKPTTTRPCALPAPLQAVPGR
jgi:hypothetical protein